MTEPDDAHHVENVEPTVQIVEINEAKLPENEVEPPAHNVEPDKETKYPQEGAEPGEFEVLRPVEGPRIDEDTINEEPRISKDMIDVQQNLQPAKVQDAPLLDTVAPVENILEKVVSPKAIREEKLGGHHSGDDKDDDRRKKKEKKTRKHKHRSHSPSLDRKAKHRSHSPSLDRKAKHSRSSPRREKKRSRSRSRGRRGTDLVRSRSRRSRSRSKKRSRSRSKGRRSRGHRSRSRDKPSRSLDRGRSRRSRSRERKKSSKKYSSESSDDYGGYVPRKRHNEKSRRDSSKARDSEPPGSAAAVPGFSPMLSTQLVLPADPQEALKVWQEQQLKSRLMVLQQQAAAAVTSQGKVSREIYVGNLIPGVTNEAILRQIFNSALSAGFPGSGTMPGTEPVVNVNLHTDGKYAFIELRTPEMATATLALSGQISLLGQTFNIARPSAYQDPVKAQAAVAAVQQALAAFQAGDPSVAQGMGLLAPPPTALMGVNPMLGLPASVAAPAVAAITSGFSPVMQSLPGPPVMSSMAIAPGSGPAPLDIARDPSAYLVVSGMITADVLADETEYRDVVDDLNEECGKAGPVIGVKVPRPADPSQSASFFGSGHFGRAFVQFRDSGSAVRAKETIHGRLFAGSVVNVQFITAACYAAVPA